LEDFRERIETQESLRRSQQYLTQKDYEAALKENERILSLSLNRPPSDEALFNLGTIYAHYENPRRNYEKSLFFFRTLVKNYPKSLLLDQAKTWAELLEENRRFNNELENIRQTVEKSERENQRLKRENQRVNSVIEGLKKMITKSKQVDIEVEQKKREEVR
jgi:tetratricopeptide (TPR) repeat protein